MKSRNLFMMLILIVGIRLVQAQMTVSDSDNNILMQVNDEGVMGSITLPDTNTALSTQSNKLYNLNGSLIWNGTALGLAGSAGGWTDDGPTVRLTTSTDKVGMGTTTPEAGLHLKGSGFPKSFMYLQAETGGGAGFRLYEGSVAKWHIFNNYSLDGFHIYNNTGQTVFFADQGTANVGIGTTDPEFKLSLNNDGGILAQGTHGAGATISSLGEGTRLIWYPRKAAFRAGWVAGTAWDDGNMGSYSFATGWDTYATGMYSTAMGEMTMASGSNSVAVGRGSDATGMWSFAGGSYSTASGVLSMAMGSSATAAGDVSTAFGQGTSADAYASFVIGRYNEGGGTDDSWVATDPLFEIGNGADVGSEANAVTVLKNGNTGIGILNPGTKLDVSDIVRVSGNTWPAAGKGLEMAYNSTLHKGIVQVYNHDASTWGDLYLGNGKVGIGTEYPSSKLQVNGGDIKVTSGSFIDDGTTLNVPDYVFKPDYELESIEEHADYMWIHKHLPAVTSASELQSAPNGYHMSVRREQILEELEKAHIYIEQLCKRIEELEKRVDGLDM